MVLGKRLLIATQARDANRLDHQREVLMNANGPRFPSHNPINFREHLQVPSAAQAGALGKDRPTRAHQPVGPFLGFKERNAQARLFQGEVLRLVERLRLLPGAFVQDRVREREETTAQSQPLYLRAEGKLLHP